jgi:hypothetical protein
MAAIPASLVAGVPATLTMDVTMVLASRIGGPAFTSEKLAPNVIGRWGLALARGRWRHEDIAAEPPVCCETAAGLAIHYLTGIALTLTYLLGARAARLRPGVTTATASGLATGALPFFILYPSWGYGWMGLKSGEAARLARVMLIGHAAFGAGIGLWTSLLSTRRGEEVSP